MSKFLYFLGGCAAGALAVVAAQAFTEDDYSSSSRSSSCDDHDKDIESSTLDVGAESYEAATQGMATAQSTLFADAATAAGSACPEGTAPDMQKMSEQLTCSVIGLVNDFLRQSHATQKQDNNTVYSATIT